MSPDFAVQIGREALYVAVLLASPILLSALIVGVLVGMFQAATQINEQTMSFVPKLGVLVLILFLLSPWMLATLVDFTRSMFLNVPGWVS
ncbi:MAG: flagellar biosynthesis protein FliQ [Ectothiorhodospiraceae bacterium]|nr:flagellar biosynthesis protein FliQ [Ectothiorhodospiraceae bacterium]MCH8504005.1 flagellar biosynthesis protein FliQ [Ectothiorhodospiraceae bacterium]